MISNQTMVNYLYFKILAISNSELIKNTGVHPVFFINTVYVIVFKILAIVLFPSWILYYVRINRGYRIRIREPFVFPCHEANLFTCVRF